MPQIVTILASAILVFGLFQLPIGRNSQEYKDAVVGASQSISSLTELTTLAHDDVLPITDTDTLTTKKVKWGTATSTLKTLFDPLYSPIAGSASLTTLGTVTTGTWNADTISVAKGGTGSTSLIAYQLLAGNGAGAVTTFGNGTAGYVLTSNGASALPSFQNVGVTTNANNTWTGTNTFTATTTIAASSTTNNAFVLNGLPYKFPSSRGASSTVLMENGSGELSFGSSSMSYWIVWTHQAAVNPTDEQCVVPFSSETFGTCTNSGYMISATGTIRNLRTRESSAPGVRNNLTNVVSVVPGDLIRFSFEDTPGDVRSIVVQVNGADSALALAASGTAGTSFHHIGVEFIPSGYKGIE